MIYYEVLRPYPLGYPSGIKGCTVELLVWLENISVGIKTEGFTHHPVGTLGIMKGVVVAWLVAKAYKAGAVGKVQDEAILLFFLRQYVETLKLHGTDAELVAVGKLMKDYCLAYLTDIVLVERHVADCIYNLYNFVVAIDIKHSMILAGYCLLHYHPYHPYHSEDMVGVGMGDKDVVDVVQLYSRLLQLAQYAVAATGIYKQLVGT